VRRRETGSLSISLFDLAPNGVCHAPSITLGAVVSYTTFSPLLGGDGFRRRVQAVCFLWHFPCPTLNRGASPATEVVRDVLPSGVRTFLPWPKWTRATERLAQSLGI